MSSAQQHPGKRARRREHIEGEILRAARIHLATEGAAGLSLRAVARDLGMVSSGIYRYVESRDDLLTRLIADSYRSLAEIVRAAHDAVDEHDLVRCWVAIGFAFRGWALSRPHHFALLYGSPVPDYEAPADRTVEVGTRVLGLVVQLLQDAHERQPDVPVGLPMNHATPGAAERSWEATPLADAAARAVGPMLLEPFFEHCPIGPAELARGLAAWTLVSGAISSEVFGQLGTLPDPDALFTVQLHLAGWFFLPDSTSLSEFSTP